MSAKKDLLIRDLDFISHENGFNEANPSDPSYATQVSDQGFLVRSHSMGPGAKEENASNLRKKNDGDCQLQWSDDASSSFRTQGKFTIAIAYTLKLHKLREPLFPESLLVNAPVSLQDYDSAMQKLRQECYEAQCFTNAPHIDFGLRRNLEHILSVCSIPVDPADKGELH
ncbi:uncharacterized protein NECHADRAFT_89210 [Fusarium vanettenii 77-13-4]|uniref:Uncharacterized protein n=1 Tax=Fusarium vanettenii (strain ATCC MYA-4622 / CBS 123669 / FGSC 9596 / NRRL 45880 / 77-13-4) TaxID=660122 RepID=C7ZQI4_FUSV7|nr:uncharacterized protein NECHADRAFT_89210 [Fusarium vanettenii 77-13-4]EEU33725.1 hypothetical protein NECHADRAFT_89210 [Fusarium vanettenii 77-13-4]